VELLGQRAHAFKLLGFLNKKILKNAAPLLGVSLLEKLIHVDTHTGEVRANQKNRG
jgi:hypothetical protein